MVSSQYYCSVLKFKMCMYMYLEQFDNGGVNFAATNAFSTPFVTYAYMLEAGENERLPVCQIVASTVPF